MRAATAGLNLTDSVYERLLRERIIVLGSQVNDDIANQICAQLLLLAAEDPDAGHPRSTSTRRAARSPPAWPSTTRCSSIERDVATYAMGLAASMGQFLLSAGARGQALRAAARRILMHQPSAACRRHGGGHRDPGRAC